MKKESKESEKVYQEKLKQDLVKKKETVKGLKEPLEILSEAISNPPYRCRDEEIVKEYATFVNQTFREHAKSYKTWKNIVKELDRDECISLTSYTLYFLRMCGTCKKFMSFNMCLIFN